MDAIYNIKDEVAFDSMVNKIGKMAEQEKQFFMALLQGYQEGVRVGQRIAENRQEESA